MKRRKSLVGAWVSRFIFTTTWTAHTIQRWIPTAAQKLKQRSNFCSKFSSLCLCSRPVQTACRSKANLSQRGKSNRVEGKSLYRFFDTNLAKLHRFQQAEFLPEVYYQAIILTHQDTVQQILGPLLCKLDPTPFHFTWFRDNITDFQTFLVNWPQDFRKFIKTVILANLKRSHRIRKQAHKNYYPHPTHCLIIHSIQIE